MKESNEESPRGRKPNDPGIAWNGHALRVRRVLRGLTLRTLGDLVGVGESAISRWELDQRAPDAEAVVKLAEVLECDPAGFSKPPSLR